MWTISSSLPPRVLTKRLRLFFRHDRSLLGDLTRAVWETVAEVYRDVLGREDILPGMIAGIQTFGQLVHFHPHAHTIVTDGGFAPNGAFVCLPRIEPGRVPVRYPRGPPTDSERAPDEPRELQFPFLLKPIDSRFRNRYVKKYAKNDFNYKSGLHSGPDGQKRVIFPATCSYLEKTPLSGRISFDSGPRSG